MKHWGNLFGYQIVWLGTVWGAGTQRSWLGPLLAILFVAYELGRSQSRRRDLQLIGLALVAGLILDGTLAGTGMARYAPAVPSLPIGPAPLWILTLWAAFAMTLARSLSFLRGRPLGAALLGGIGGPLAYLGATRFGDAIVFTEPTWMPLLVLAVGWAITLPLLFLATNASNASRNVYVSAIKEQRP